VTNYHVTAEDIQAALQIIRGVLGAD
jgi:hypothetical protein